MCVLLGDLLEHVLPDFPAHERAGGREDDQAGELVKQIHHALVTPMPEVILSLLDLYDGKTRHTESHTERVSEHSWFQTFHQFRVAVIF